MQSGTIRQSILLRTLASPSHASRRGDELLDLHTHVHGHDSVAASPGNLTLGYSEYADPVLGFTAVARLHHLQQ